MLSPTRNILPSPFFTRGCCAGCPTHPREVRLRRRRLERAQALDVDVKHADGMPTKARILNAYDLSVCL